MANYMFLSTEYINIYQEENRLKMRSSSAIIKLAYARYSGSIMVICASLVRGASVSYTYSGGSSGAVCNNTYNGNDTLYYSGMIASGSDGTPLSGYSILNGYDGALSAFDDGVWTPTPVLYPISYRLTNCTAPSAPAEAAIGDTVVVPFQFTSGYGIVNPSSDIYVTNNGVIVPSMYSNGILTFTMPDPT